MKAKPVTQEEIAAYREECLHIDETRLREEYLGVPAAVAFWGERYAGAQEAFALAKLRAEREMAALRDRAVGEFTSFGKKITEDAIAAQIAKYPEYQEMGERVARAEYAKNAARSMVDAVQSKWEIVINLGAHLRTEMRADARSL